jgi:hypothetical protein
MKKIFAFALLMSFASIALADGSGPPPKLNKAAVIQLADGSGLPPVKKPVESSAI